jgi:large subunit ribosomal protein L6
MSRVGRKVIPVPSGVKVSIGATAIEVQGPKGKLSTPVPPGIKFVLTGAELSCQRANDERQQRAFHGLARALAQNAIKGVTEGFSKDLDIVGVGYKAAVEGSKVVFALGYSHPVEYKIPEGIKIAVDKRPGHRLRDRPPEGRPGGGGDPRPAEAGSLQAEGDPLRGRDPEKEGGQGRGNRRSEVRQTGNAWGALPQGTLVEGTR